MTVTTLDITSGGRAILGLGAAWNESEHIGYGFDFPRVGERMDRLDEALTIAKLLFTQDRSTFEGKFSRIENALNVPKPVQAGGPPIMIGGGGEQRTLRIAAKHADMTHWFPLGRDMLKHKTEVLEGYCAELGRDPSTIQRTMAAPAIVARDEAAKTALLEAMPPERRPYIQGGTPQQAAEALKPFLDDGFVGFTFNNTFYKTREQIALVAEVLERIGG
jgi:alkanesulfonate monooxygenase SsuD/methylene tetrahydromethanopterin reductase-like flavin-dependent oxidoreductase (luciferase family)